MAILDFFAEQDCAAKKYSRRPRKAPGYIGVAY
jgi:hypothetical protein